MPASNPSASAPTGAQPPDVAQLVALLGSLMPLLMRFQSQGFQWQIPEPPFQAGLGNVMIPDPTLDHQAAVNLVGDIIADSLRNLSAYLETHTGRHPGLESCVPIVTQAARSFAARDYAQAFNLIWQAYRMIAMIRAGDPQLPPLRPVGQGSSDQSSLH
jgi:hypothetical protein